MSRLLASLAVTTAALMLVVSALAAQETPEVTPSITVSDQLSLDGMIVIDSVTSEAQGWISLHPDLGNGQPGPVVGIAPVQPGVNENLAVLFDALGATPNMLAMLHVDAGQMGIFEYGMSSQADAPVTINDQPVMAPFRLTAIRTYDQMPVQNTVLVGSVISDTGGWIVIHADDNGQPGAVLGQAQVAPGTIPSVPVVVPEGSLTPMVWAMLHLDDNAVGAYEFGTVEGADSPVRVNDQVAVAPLNITDTIPVLNAAGIPLDTPAEDGAATEPVIPGLLVAADQPVSDPPTAVLIDTAMTQGPAWIDVHANAGTHPGKSVGLVPLPGGQLVDLTVGLDANLDPTAPPFEVTPIVWPMLHNDDNGEGIYEYMMIPGADLPIVVNGTVVTLPVIIGDVSLPPLDVTAEATAEATVEATMEATDEADDDEDDEATPEATMEATVEIDPDATAEATPDGEPGLEVTVEVTAEVPGGVVEVTPAITPEVGGG